MTVFEWLKAGEAFLTPDQLGSVKQMLKDGIVRERELALARAAALDAQARALDGSGGAGASNEAAPSHPGSNGVGTKPLFPAFPTSIEARTDFTKMTVPDVIGAVIAKYPNGISGPDLVKLVAEARGVDRGSIYKPLTILADEGTITKKGYRQGAMYYPKEARAM